MQLGQQLCLQCTRQHLILLSPIKSNPTLEIPHASVPLLCAGWLLNIENSLPLALVPNVLHFVSHLRARMAACVQNSMVMW